MSKKNLIVLGCFIIIYLIIVGVLVVTKKYTLNEEILRNVVIVNDGKIDSNNEGKLVLVTGDVSYQGTIDFRELDYSFDSFMVTRNVYDYVTDEESKYAIRSTMKDENSSNYLDKIYTETRFLDLYIGDYVLNSEGIQKIKTNVNFSEDVSILGLKYDGEYYSNPKHVSNPVEGDVRISYSYYDTSDMKFTILAKQVGNSFEDYEIDGNKVYNVYESKIDSIDGLEEVLGTKLKKDFRWLIVLGIMIVLYGVYFIVDRKKA